MMAEEEELSSMSVSSSEVTAEEMSSESDESPRVIPETPPADDEDLGRGFLRVSLEDLQHMSGERLDAILSSAGLNAAATPFAPAKR